MDFRSVTGLTIPAGNVNKISIGGVVYWNKEISASSKYKIMKDGIQIAQVTMSRLVKQVNSGAAQEDYGIGAQIIVPYNDPFNNTEYELPFNFGTFTAVGNKKLGLQAHYGVPSKNVPYGGYCTWYLSYFRRWANNSDISTLKGTDYYGKRSFIESLPEDFTDFFGTHTVRATKVTTEPEEDADDKIFLLSVTQSHALGSYMVSDPSGAIEGTAWEYWKQKIGDNAQKYGYTNTNRIVYAVNNTSLPVSTFTRTLYASTNKYGITTYYVHYFAERGYTSNSSPNLATRYLPACVIG